MQPPPELLYIRHPCKMHTNFGIAAPGTHRTMQSSLAMATPIAITPAITKSANLTLFSRHWRSLQLLPAMEFSLVPDFPIPEVGYYADTPKQTRASTLLPAAVAIAT